MLLGALWLSGRSFRRFFSPLFVDWAGNHQSFTQFSWVGDGGGCRAPVPLPHVANNMQNLLQLYITAGQVFEKVKLYVLFAEREGQHAVGKDAGGEKDVAPPRRTLSPRRAYRPQRVGRRSRRGLRACPVLQWTSRTDTMEENVFDPAIECRGGGLLLVSASPR